MNHTIAFDVSEQAALANCGTMPVFERLGMIVRALHDALGEIGVRHVLADAQTDFPSARERLIHIASLTENAANLVLSKVEQNVPLLDTLVNRAADLEKQWSVSADGATDAIAADSRMVATRAFLADVQTDCGTTRTALSDIMMAQDFQDLTGQMIKKVTTLMERTENDLLKLLIDAAPPGTIVNNAEVEMLAGPAAPGLTTLDQENVDDLLAELGF